MQGRLTVLGSGTSTGLPMIGCHCAVCDSTDPRDRRWRPSIWLAYNRHSVLVDTGPDLRAQALRFGLERLDAVLYTHSHADHILGLDDVRPFNYGRPDALPLYAAPGVLADLRRVFRYAFEGSTPGSSRPRLTTHEIAGPLALFGARIEPLPVRHGEMEVLGYRFGRNAYVTDFSEIPPASLERLRGLDVLILDALRRTPHPTHSNLENSLRLVRELRPARAYFTHIAHELRHAAVEAELPPGVHLAHDGLALDVEMEAA